MVEPRVLEDAGDVGTARDVVVTSWTRCCSSAAVQQHSSGVTAVMASVASTVARIEEVWLLLTR